MIDGRWRSQVGETTTNPELDRVSVMAGGNLWHLPLPPSLSSHRKAAGGVLPVRAKVVDGVCGHPSYAMQPAPLVPIKTPSHPLPAPLSHHTIAVSQSATHGTLIIG